jgi:membrane protease YdiL (CAAX protease family)
MQDQVNQAQVCVACGELIVRQDDNQSGLCAKCEGVRSTQYQPSSAEPFDLQGEAVPPFGGPYSQTRQAAAIDPDNPGWGPLTGIGTWLFSVIALIFVQAIAVFGYYFYQRGQGVEVPNLQDTSAFATWVQSPEVLFVAIISTIGAHLLTFLICWAVVRGFKKRPFLASLGWHWAGHSVLYWIGISIAIIGSLILFNNLLLKVLPQAETPFDEMLKASVPVKYAVAFMATFTAPFIEEVIYRGVLYGGLRSRISVVPTILTVTMLFAAVHMLQYQGGWVTIVSLAVLSLILTIVRARTKSILPPVLIHTINNAFFSTILVLGFD